MNAFFIKALATLLMTTKTTKLCIAQSKIIKEHYNYKNPVLEIPKINLKKEFYPNNKELNTVSKNIQVINTSKMPTEKNTNLILAAHSGNSNIGYFKHLDQLQTNDIAYIYYKEKKYKYIITKIYDVYKTGYVSINRDQDKTTLTLITCKKNTNLQTVYISYLERVEYLHKKVLQ